MTSPSDTPPAASLICTTCGHDTTEDGPTPLSHGEQVCPMCYHVVGGLSDGERTGPEGYLSKEDRRLMEAAMWSNVEPLVPARAPEEAAAAPIDDVLLEERMKRLFGDELPDDKHSIMALSECDGCSEDLTPDQEPVGLCAFCLANPSRATRGAPEEAAVPTTRHPLCKCGHDAMAHLDFVVAANCLRCDCPAFVPTPAAPAVAVPGEAKAMSEHDLEKTENGQLGSSSPRDATMRRYPANFGEQRRGIKAVLLPLGSVDAIERLARDVMAFGYGMGEAPPRSSEQLKWYEKAKTAIDALMENVRALATERDEFRAALCNTCGKWLAEREERPERASSLIRSEAPTSRSIPQAVTASALTEAERHRDALREALPARLNDGTSYAAGWNSCLNATEALRLPQPENPHA